MTRAALWRRVFYALCAPWSLLMGWYALDLPPGERLDALGPWAVGSVAAAAFALLGRGLHGGVQAWSTRPSHRDASPIPAAAGAASAASTEPTLQLRACFARLEQHPPERLAAQLAQSTSHAPLLADDPPHPSASLAERGMALQVRLAQAMDMLVSNVPSAGPVPVFTLAPTLNPDSRYAAADWPGLMAAQATVRPPLLRAMEQNGPSLAPVLQALHAQFSASPMLCNAVLLSVDGELIRGHYSSQRRDPDTPRLPPVHDSVVVLWITRDGLPTALRQQAVDANSTDGKRARQAMAWWSREMDSVHALSPDEAQTRVLPTATVDALLKAYRASDDPELADHARAARMLGDDTRHPVPWHPVPWSTQQVEAYDAAAVLARLPPPFTCRCTTRTATDCLPSNASMRSPPAGRRCALACRTIKRRGASGTTAAPMQPSPSRCGWPCAGCCRRWTSTTLHVPWIWPPDWVRWAVAPAAPHWHWQRSAQDGMSWSLPTATAVYCCNR